MIVTFVHIWVKEPFVAEFIQATRENHEHTRREEGNLRFDILADENDPAKFVIYEVFASDEAINAHKKTPHYLKWRDMVADWMAQPRQGIRHRVICPESQTSW